MQRNGVLNLDKAPSLVKLWVQNNAGLQFSPFVEDVSAYGSEWRAWWKDLQPSGRIGARDWPLLKSGWSSDSEWDGLRKGSAQGFALLLISLWWWEERIRSAKERKFFESTLDDVGTVVIVLAGGKVGRSKRSNNASEDVNPHKRYVPDLDFFYILSNRV